MEIRGPGDGRPARRVGGPTGPLPADAAPARRDPGAGGAAPDSFARGEAAAEEDAPFWLIRMSADRAAGRQFLDARARRAARDAERAWIAAWAAAAPPPPGPGQAGKAGLDAWQAWVDALCRASGAPIGVPRVVWQHGMGPKGPARGQYLFRVDGGLLQLRPGGPGTPAEWAATVAHEAFHHAQHALVVALYRGSPDLPAPLDALAAYYRDARIAYKLGGPDLPPADHARQDLEVGAWAFGEAIARRAKQG